MRLRTFGAPAVAIVLGIGTTAVLGAAAAQRGGGQGMGPMHYDTATEVTLTGTVDEVRLIPGPGRGQGGLHLMVRDNGNVTEVHVGPTWFVTSKSFEFAIGDAITVTGSKVTLEGQEVVIAREARKGDGVLKLRDENGFPLWSGRAWSPPAGHCRW